MFLYDTKARKKVEVIVKDETLKIYACGPTVYRDAHVGNMRTFLLNDLIHRTALAKGWKVQLIQNITDVGHMVDDTDLAVDDKMLEQSKTEKISALEIAEKYQNRFLKDLDRLNILPATKYPKASESIDLMIDLISTLINKGFAYQGKDGSVFFDANSFSDYGAISGNRLSDLKPGHRFETELDDNKKFHADWGLWKIAPTTRTQLVWDTPWGVGFPGWHIECSAMSLHLLGTDIDIHTGGIDLRFPHHEDERAQSNAASGKEVVKHWVHAEHLLFEGRKMSKSTQNVVLVEDVIKRGFNPLCLRLVFLEHRYRQQLDLTWNSIQAADKTLQRWYKQIEQWQQSPSEAIDESSLALISGFMENDLDSVNAILTLREVEKSNQLNAASKLHTFRQAEKWLGLGFDQEFKSTNHTFSEEVNQLAQQRIQARADKDWAASDRLRDELKALGVLVVDTANGQEITPLP
jgi:cysteinyl-tRNA synthetase